MIGRHPELGGHYAVSGDGVGKITCDGCTLAELFPAEGAQQGRQTVEYFAVEEPESVGVDPLDPYASIVRPAHLRWYWTVAPHPVCGGPFETKDQAMSAAALARHFGEI